jgi:hypothetical protein
MRFTLLIIALYSSLPCWGDELQQASWSVPQVNEVRKQAQLWLQEKKTTTQQQDASLALIDALPESTAGDQLLKTVVEMLAMVEPKVGEMVDFCRTPPPETGPRSFAILNDDTQSAWLIRNARLYYGSWLARHQLFDEAAEQLASLKPNDVVDPAGLLFYQAVVSHRLMQKKECLLRLSQLLENEAILPQRYINVAKLMHHDLKTFEPDSLDEISRLMDDVRRRLELGRAGKKVRDEEAEIIAKLEKKIKEQEEQRKKQQQQQAANKSQKPSQQDPAQKTEAPRDIQATDETDPKQFNKANQWGNLPPKQRQQAMQQIGRDLPSHFRDTIEEYFKRLAQDGNE